MSKESKPSVLAAFDRVTVDAVRAEIAEHQTVIDGHQKQIDALREIERIVAKRDGIEIDVPKRTWSRKKKVAENESEEITPVVKPAVLPGMPTSKGIKAVEAPKAGSVLDQIIGALRAGPMSVRKIEDETGILYQSVYNALNSGPGTAHIRKVPGTSAPALYELIK